MQKTGRITKKKRKTELTNLGLVLLLNVGTGTAGLGLLYTRP